MKKAEIILTGFADEATTAGDIDTQIRATKEVGWRFLDLRTVNGRNIVDITDHEFDVVRAKLEDADLKVHCLGSKIGKCHLNNPLELSLEQARRAIRRMQQLDMKLIRIMSFSILADRGPEDQMAEERFRRLRKLQEIFSDAGITPVHENCSSYGSMGWAYTLKLVENVPGLRLVFDTGNPVATDDRTKPIPYPKQSSWEFYTHVKEHIEYVHIKDGVWDAAAKKAIWTYPGQGDGDVCRILRDVLDSGYDGAFGMEPHLAATPNDDNQASIDEIKYINYVQYCRCFGKLLADVRRQQESPSVAARQAGS